MSDLLSFQQQFICALKDADLDLTADPDLRRAIRVHRNTAMPAAQDALAANFPVVRALVGEEAFAACAAGYTEANPPGDPRLCLYGKRFDAFLSSYIPFAELPWLVGIARLERLHVEALFAADALPFDPSSAAGALTVDSRLSLHPAVRMLAFDAPVASLWLAHQPSAAADAIRQVEWRPEIALVTRPLTTVIVSVVDPAVAAFLSACLRGESLGDAARATAERDGNVAESFAALIGAGAFIPDRKSVV